jgi:acyl-CoA thioesterase YciA
MIYRSRKMVMPAHLNGASTLFGGQALAWVDEEAAIFAACQLGTGSLVTKLMSEINFLAPARIGDIVEVGAELVAFGKTSITVRCAMRNKTTKQDILLVDKIVFVHVDAQGKPKPHGVTGMRDE